MNSHSKVLTEQEAREALDLLANWFETQRVELRWSLRQRRGRAYYRRGLVSTGPNCWRGTTDSLLHEFAHILCFRYALRRGLTDGRGHGRDFQHTLHQVAAAWYGNAHGYGWKTEYKNVKAYAVREGIYTPEPDIADTALPALYFRSDSMAAGVYQMLGKLQSLSLAGPKEKK